MERHHLQAPVRVSWPSIQHPDGKLLEGGDLMSSISTFPSPGIVPSRHWVLCKQFLSQIITLRVVFFGYLWVITLS